MNDSQLTRLFAATAGDEEPALRPEYVERTLLRARRSARRRRGLGTLAAVAAVLVVLLLLSWPGHLFHAAPPAAPAGRPTLPEQFADYSRLTSHASERPPGRAIALFEYGSSELFTTWQTLVVGADRDTYRRVNTNNNVAPPVLLSPDGTRLLYYEAKVGTDEFTLMDLATGRTRVLHSVEWVSNVGAGLTMLAWSPDGRYVAYAVPAPPPADGKAASSYAGGEPIRQLAILDVTNDTTVRYPEISPVLAAAFAPDGQRLAVQMAVGQSWIVSVRGERLQPWTLPAGTKLASGAAWSPDGKLLATIAPPLSRADGSITWADARVRFVDATGAGHPPPGDLPYSDMLGWRTPTSIVVQSWLHDVDADAIVEVSVVDGSRTVLSRFSSSKSCEFGLQRCQAFRIQLATALLGSVDVRPSDPDRGPWVPVVHALMVLVPVLVAVVVARRTIRAVRRRRAKS